LAVLSTEIVRVWPIGSVVPKYWRASVSLISALAGWRKACRCRAPSADRTPRRTGVDLRDIRRSGDAAPDDGAAVLAALHAGADDAGKVLADLFEQAAHRIGIGAVERAFRHVPHGLHHINAIMAGQPFLIAGFEPGIEAQDEEHRDPHRQSADIERGIELVAGERAVKREQREAVHPRPPQIDRMAEATMRPSSMSMRRRAMSAWLGEWVTMTMVAPSSLRA
jgi:hypothetical protein